ncbi:hypothetical protein CR513_12084, partial [Mucuna pruriens]
MLISRTSLKIEIEIKETLYDSSIHLNKIMKPILNKYTHNPNSDNWNALLRLLKYLKDTMD